MSLASLGLLNALERNQTLGGADLSSAGKEGQLVGELPGSKILHACDALLVCIPLPPCTKHSTFNSSHRSAQLTA